MATFKAKMKKFGRYVWELFKGSLPSAFMYFCAGTILLMLVMREEELVWTSGNVAWTVVCIIGGAAYNALTAWAHGGSHYEMLVSGNVKRMSAEQLDGGYKISAHKEAKEYRIWKGFAMGGFSAIYTIIIGILFGCMQTKIDTQQLSGGLAGLVLVGFLLSGWSVIPLYVLNIGGAGISYFISLLFALIPIAVSGGFYIAGAYARRAKRLREQYIAEQTALREATREKKINYGGLPGTKPKKRK